jgi:two-component sensor histidine kinase
MMDGIEIVREKGTRQKKGNGHQKRTLPNISVVDDMAQDTILTLTELVTNAFAV